MKYKKWAADYIFTGYEMLQGNHVLITDETGVVVDIIDKNKAGDDVEVFRGILSPGFINAHCHLELSHLKGFIPEHTGLVDFILKVVAGRHFEEEKILDSIKMAEDEMLQNGIVAVGDICNNTLTIPQKTKQRLHYHNFIEVSGFPPFVAAKRFEKSTTILADYISLLPTTNSVLSPHAPYSVSPDLFQMLNNETANQTITIHNQEINGENDLFLNRSDDFLRLYKEMSIDISFFEASGISSLQTWLPYFNRNQKIIAVHNVCTSDADIEFAQLQTTNHKSQTFYCLCPNANLYISNTMPDVIKFMRHHCNIVLGTDSLASNHQLSIWEEIKTLQKNFPDLLLATILQWATINGARALGMDNMLGSFEKGKKPGLLLLSANVTRLV